MLRRSREFAAAVREWVALLADRWQIPAALIAVLCVAYALNRLRPVKKQVPFESLVADCIALRDAGAYYLAADAVANLLEAHELTRLQQATLHNLLADIIYRQEALRPVPIRANVRKLLEHHERAIALGHRASAADVLRYARAHEWLGHGRKAYAAYREVLQRDPSSDQRRAALQALVRLLEGRPEQRDERRQYIEALLAEEGVSTPYLWWALQQAIGEALQRGQVERAAKLLEQIGGRLKRDDLRGYYEYLWAWVDLARGQIDEAAPRVDWVDQWIEDHPSVDSRLDQAGYLPALNRWLRGRIHLADGRPQQALETFASTLGLQSHGEMFVRATIGRIEALAALERHDRALAVLDEAVRRLERQPSLLASARPRLRQLLLRIYRDRHQRPDYPNAVRYLAKALELTPEDEKLAYYTLIERLAIENEQAAAGTDDPQLSARYHAAAGRYYEQALGGARDAEHEAALLWSAAEQYDAAGRLEDLRRVLKTFVERRSIDPRLPRALLQLGRSYAAEGRFDEATKWYRRLIDQFPMLEEASRARLLTAEGLIAVGGHDAEAETMLVELLEDERIAPQALVYRDALLALCNLLYDQGRYSEAISRIEEFLDLYPDDSERLLVQFLRADAYRHSAYALRDGTIAREAPAQRRLAEARRRFREAARAYAAFLAALPASPTRAADPQTADPFAPASAPSSGPAGTGDSGQSLTSRELRFYPRLALMYRGDCLFELNTPESLAEALAVYRQVVATYQNEPAALVAQIQIANIRLRQGRLTEAARAVERARWLLEAIPDQAFGELPGLDNRADWDRYLKAVMSSPLLSGVFREAG